MSAFYSQNLRRMPTNAAFEADNSSLSPPGAEKKPLRKTRWQAQGYTTMIVMLHWVPPAITTLDIYNSFAPLAILSIDIIEDTSGERTGSVRVRLVPPPFDFWYDRAWKLQVAGPPPRSYRVQAVVDVHKFTGSITERIQTPLRHLIQPVVDFSAALFGQGFMHQKRTMMVMDELRTSTTAPGSVKPDDVSVRLSVDFRRREMCIFVQRFFQEATNGAAPAKRMPAKYRIDIKFPWIKNMFQQRLPGGHTSIVTCLDSPPEYWRKARDLSKTHGSGRTNWSGSDQWIRMAYLTMNLQAARDAAVSLHGTFPQNTSIDIGRWTTFSISLLENCAAEWQEVVRCLLDYDIRVKTSPEFRFLPRDDRTMWDCLGSDLLDVPAATALSSNTHHLSRRLSFEVAYQLEVCISRGILQENALDVVFLESLAALTPDRGCRVLEYVAERGKRIYQPNNIFRDPRAASYWRKTPPEASLDKDRAVYVRKAIVTPTTVVFSTPALEAGNRVLRQYREHRDRFLRVQFTDELQLGRLSGGPDTQRTDECFTRAFRALKNGIHVGGRHFQFLAFGNSQLRENSAYFFAPTDLVSCQNIRDWMGDFSSIKSVAKYAARLGQCLSTTRPVPTFGVPTTVQHIPDVQRGQFCFTDGVGKISKWWARVIASHLHMNEIPSVFQFRMGGCKGIMTVWPDVPPGQVVQIRPSQEKFPTPDKVNALEIVRCSETATATLNQQTILLLTCLGVPKPVFVELLSEELAGLDAVMKDPRKAVDQLQLRVDQNHTTHLVADMVKAGFMNSDEPFVWALLQLWRSWTLKALKEKARITVEKSAFVLGCVDETDTLRGHTNKRPPGTKPEDEEDTANLPQIFLQVPDVAGGGVNEGPAVFPGGFERELTRGKYKVVTGLCLVGRNPSLHPGDLRVVEAVDVPALHHLRDVVVFPRQGDRDVPGMCSGGDLDGDDYFIFWDARLLPPRKFWNYEAMDFSATREPDVERVTPRHLISFFVQHMKHDTLPRIALSHRGYADQLDGGAMHSRCLELAQLHSQAVDYAKTGVPALLPQRLTPRHWPHWMARQNKTGYRSTTALGYIYDRVKVDGFDPVYDKPFDKRILRQYADLDMDILRRARRIKTQYDLAVRRAMAQKDIESEFEFWSGFVMTRPRVGSDYKTQEHIGRLYKVIMARFRRLCVREAAGKQDTEHMDNTDTLSPFVAAMYRVTYEEMCIAFHEMHQSRLRNRADQKKGKLPRMRMNQKSAPLISFPWLFPHELGSIAKANELASGPAAGTAKGPSTAYVVLSQQDMDKMEYCNKNGVPTHHGVPLDISAYDAGADDEDEGNGEEELYEPMWTLPPGKSEGDIVIGLAAPTGGDTDNEAEDYGDADYANLFARVRSETSGLAAGKEREARTATETGTTPKAPTNFSWAEIDEDVLSTTSEESLGEDDSKVVLLPGKVVDGGGGSVDETSKSPSKGKPSEPLASPSALDRTTRTGLDKKHDFSRDDRGNGEDRGNEGDGGDADDEKEDGVETMEEEEEEEDDEDDVFAAVDKLYGERGRRRERGESKESKEGKGKENKEKKSKEEATKMWRPPGERKDAEQSNLDVLQSLFGGAQV